MRITLKEQEAFIIAINKYLSLTNADLRLYGSRVKDDLKGGDIDLLLILSNADIYQQALQVKISILVAIKDQIGDQKIDFTITTQSDMNSSPFLRIIYPESVLLYRWE
jgi:predicted nucleotidyltransferase